jgi:hypothetical protein
MEKDQPLKMKRAPTTNGLESADKAHISRRLSIVQSDVSLPSNRNSLRRMSVALNGDKDRNSLGSSINSSKLGHPGDSPSITTRGRRISMSSSFGQGDFSRSDRPSSIIKQDSGQRYAFAITHLGYVKYQLWEMQAAHG